MPKRSIVSSSLAVDSQSLSSCQCDSVQSDDDDSSVFAVKSRSI